MSLVATAQKVSYSNIYGIPEGTLAELISRKEFAFEKITGFRFAVSSNKVLAISVQFETCIKSPHPELFQDVNVKIIEIVFDKNESVKAMHVSFNEQEKVVEHLRIETSKQLYTTGNVQQPKVVTIKISHSHKLVGLQLYSSQAGIHAVGAVSCKVKTTAEALGEKSWPRGTFFLRNVHSGLYLDAKGAGTKAGTALIQWPLHCENNQKWKFMPGGFMISVHNNLAVDVKGERGPEVICWDFHQNFNQIFSYNATTKKIVSRVGNLVLEVKNASTSSGAEVIVGQSLSANDAHQQWDLIDAHELIQQHQAELYHDTVDLSHYTVHSKPLGGFGKSLFLALPQTLQQEDQDTSMTTIQGTPSTPTKGLLLTPKIFFKEMSDVVRINREVGASKMSNYISGGLVVVSIKALFQKKSGIYQNFVQMDEKPFLEIAKDNNSICIFSSFTSKQIHQIFVHMIADRLISNWDTHQKQFGLDNQGNVISFDKEWSFTLYGEKENPKLLDLDKDHWQTASKMAKIGLYYIHRSLTIRIRNKEVVIDPKNEIIEAMFQRCENISIAFVKDCFGDLARKLYSTEKAEKFLNTIYLRAKNIRKAVYSYFGWPGCTTTIAEPWIIESQASYYK